MRWLFKYVDNIYLRYYYKIRSNLSNPAYQTITHTRGELLFIKTYFQTICYSCDYESHLVPQHLPHQHQKTTDSTEHRPPHCYWLRENYPHWAPSRRNPSSPLTWLPLPALHTISCPSPPTHSSITHPCHLPTRPQKHEEHSPVPTHPSCGTLHGGWGSPPQFLQGNYQFPPHRRSHPGDQLPPRQLCPGGQGPAGGGRGILPPPPVPLCTLPAPLGLLLIPQQFPGEDGQGPKWPLSLLRDSPPYHQAPLPLPFPSNPTIWARPVGTTWPGFTLSSLSSFLWPSHSGPAPTWAASSVAFRVETARSFRAG